MPNTFTPFGFSDYVYWGGKDTGVLSEFPLSLAAGGITSNFGQGDLVTLSSVTSAGASGIINYPTGAALSTVASWYSPGVFVSGEYKTTTGTITPITYWAANTPIFAGSTPTFKINALPGQIWAIQANGPFGNAGSIGYNYGVSGNGGAWTTPVSTMTTNGANPVTSQSTQFLNANAGAAGTNGLNKTVKIVGLAPPSVDFPTNSWTDPFPIVLVRINLHTFSAPTPSVG